MKSLRESFLNEGLKSGYWHGSDAWILWSDNEDMVILVGGYSESEAKKAKYLVDRDKDLGKYSDDIVYTNTDEWEEQQ